MTLRDVLAQGLQDAGEASMGYRFKRNIFACIASDVVIILDLEANRYSALPKTLAEMLRALRESQAPLPGPPELDALCAAGILQPTLEGGFEWPEIAVDVVRHSRLDAPLPSVGLMDIFCATWHRLCSTVRFKSQPLHVTIAKLRQRKLNALARSP